MRSCLYDIKLATLRLHGHKAGLTNGDKEDFAAVSFTSMMTDRVRPMAASMRLITVSLFAFGKTVMRPGFMQYLLRSALTFSRVDVMPIVAGSGIDDLGMVSGRVLGLELY